MRPVKLEFKGINSFSEHTIIDFGALTRGGLFGIFGDTGSGKSTIPDAISFALYGDVERSKEKTDIINNRCDAAEVKFVFDMTVDGKRKTYAVERQIKRDKYGTHKAALYEIGGESELCIADKASQVEKKIVEIIGVDFADFRKCIALPQGEFSQFVKSAPSARLALIERLFNLSRYGDKLKSKLNERAVQAELKFNNLSGRLQAFEGVSKRALKEVKSEIKESEKQLKEINEKRVKAEERAQSLKELYDRAKELSEAEKRLSEMQRQRPVIEELRAGLSVLADCREAVKTDAAIAEKRRQKAAIGEDKKTLENKIGADISLSLGLESKLKEGNYDEKIAALVAADALCVSSQSKVGELNAVNAELEKKRSDFKKCEREISELNAVCDRLKSELEALEKDFKNTSDGGLEKLVSAEIEGAVLRGEFASSLEYFTSFRSGLRVYEEDSPLYAFASKSTDEKIAEYKARISRLKGVGEGTAEGRLEKLKEVGRWRERLLGEIDACREKLTKAQASLKIKSSELENAAREGKSLRARAEALKAELELAFGKDCADYPARIEKNAAELKRIREEKRELTERYENVKGEINKTTVSLERAKTLFDAAADEERKLEEKLITIINSKGLENIDKCRALALKFESVANAEKTISDFDLSYAALSSRVGELKATEGIDGVTPESLDSARDDLRALSGESAELTGRIAVLKNRRGELEAKLRDLNGLNEEYERTEKERRLLSGLKEAIKGNKFLEYIANEYLSDISALASVTLLKLTGGRYFLTYRDNNFFAGDNFDCGNLRGVNTLSGGETFLVSLSLALALSQTICSRSLKSIEFFFLDEGFGTLDASLIDTVMDALEKLKSSSFTIGVISHVEELKNRISNKITVNKATEARGSTVSVSC